jgi:hypothetical protein
VGVYYINDDLHLYSPFIYSIDATGNKSDAV